MSSPNVMITDVSERSLQPLSPPEDIPESQDPDPSKPVHSIPITVKSIALGLLYTSPGERCRSRASSGAPSSAWRILYTCERDDEERCNERMKSVINTGWYCKFSLLTSVVKTFGTHLCTEVCPKSLDRASCTWVQDKVSVYVSKEEKSWHHLQIY